MIRRPKLEAPQTDNIIMMTVKEVYFYLAFLLRYLVSLLSPAASRPLFASPWLQWACAASSRWNYGMTRGSTARHRIAAALLVFADNSFHIPRRQSENSLTPLHAQRQLFFRFRPDVSLVCAALAHVTFFTQLLCPFLRPCARACESLRVERESIASKEFCESSGRPAAAGAALVLPPWPAVGLPWACARRGAAAEAHARPAVGLPASWLPGWNENERETDPPWPRLAALDCSLQASLPWPRGLRGRRA